MAYTAARPVTLAASLAHQTDIVALPMGDSQAGCCPDTHYYIPFLADYIPEAVPRLASVASLAQVQALLLALDQGGTDFAAYKLNSLEGLGIEELRGLPLTWKQRHWPQLHYFHLDSSHGEGDWAHAYSLHEEDRHTSPALSYLLAPLIPQPSATTQVMHSYQEKRHPAHPAHWQEASAQVAARKKIERLARLHHWFALARPHASREAMSLHQAARNQISLPIVLAAPAVSSIWH